jgi:hypothetical protein
MVHLSPGILAEVTVSWKRKSFELADEALDHPERDGYHVLCARHGYRIACILTDFYREGDDKMIYVKEMCARVQTG